MTVVEGQPSARVKPGIRSDPVHSLVLAVFNSTGKKHDHQAFLCRAERPGQANAHKDVMAQVEEPRYRTYGSLRNPWKNL
jgi:hypothetical protein